MKVQLEAQLIRSAKVGSTDALNRIFERCGAQLLSLIRFRLQPSRPYQLDPQDLLQETLLKAFERIDQFQGSGGQSFIGWLEAIARNEMLDRLQYLRRKGRDVARTVPLDELPSAPAGRDEREVERIAARRRNRRLHRALRTLTAEHRQVLVLRAFDELGFREIAARMGRSPDACRMLHVRARAALSREMKGSGVRRGRSLALRL